MWNKKLKEKAGITQVICVYEHIVLSNRTSDHFTEFKISE